MFKQKYVVAVLALVILFNLSITAFSAETKAVEISPEDRAAFLEELNTIIDRKPGMLLEVIYAIARLHEREGKTDEAIGLYEMALKISPDDKAFLEGLAYIYSQRAEYEKAADIFKRLIELNPLNQAYYNMLSDSYNKAGDRQRLTAFWDETAQKSDSADFILRAANFYSDEGNMDKAIKLAEKAINIDPKNAGYLRDLESFYMKANDFNNAEITCDKILSISRDQGVKDWLDSEIVNIYEKQGKLGELPGRLEKDLAKDPNNVKLYKRLAEMYHRDGQMDKAIIVCEKANKTGVADIDINRRLLDLYELSGKLDKAVPLLKKMIAMYPKEAYLKDRLADLLDKAGKQKEAEESVKKKTGDWFSWFGK